MYHHHKIMWYQKKSFKRSPPRAQFNENLSVIRRGSRINTDRFPKRAPKAQASSGVREKAPPGKKLDFYYLKSPFLGFQVIQTECWPDGNLESVFIIKNIQEKLSSLETY